MTRDCIKSRLSLVFSGRREETEKEGRTRYTRTPDLDPIQGARKSMKEEERGTK